MDNTINLRGLLRLTGLFGVAIGVAWAIQTVGFGHETLGADLSWVVAAAAMCGAGAGAIVASTVVRGDSASLAHA